MRVSDRSAGVRDQAELTDEPDGHPNESEAAPQPAQRAMSPMPPMALDTRPGNAPDISSGGALLSPRKLAFMAQPLPRRTIALPVEVYRQIAKDYKTQHGIDIRLNGGDDNPILQQAQRKWLQDRAKGLTGDLAHVSVAKAVYDKLSPEDLLAYLEDVEAFLYPHEKGEVFEADSEAFTAKIKTSPRWKGIFEQEIAHGLRHLAADAQTLGLTLEQAAQTIIDLMPQAAAAPIAFLRPSVNDRLIGVGTGPSHMASFILTQRLVIGITGDRPEMYVAAVKCPPLRYAETNLSRFMLGTHKKVAAQSDICSCGSLAVSLLKELLKKDAHQLLNDCLIISNAARKPPSADLTIDQFLPSPQSLRYSQSTLFIKVARGVVAGMEPEVDLHHRGQTYRVRTLMGLQLLGAQLTMVDGRKADLDEFRARWLQQLDALAMPARRVMQSGPEGGGRNLYLNYVVHRHARRFEVG